MNEIVRWLESPEGENWSRKIHSVDPFYHRTALVSVIEDEPESGPETASAIVAHLWYANGNTGSWH